MDKNIIIDGVNVWSCKHYDLENNYCDQSYLGEGGLLKNTKNPKRCECSPNCYYKQLKRLEQENAELKEYEYYYLDKYIDLRQALEEIRSYVNTQLDGFGNDVYGITKNQITTITNKINEVLGNG